MYSTVGIDPQTHLALLFKNVKYVSDIKGTVSRDWGELLMVETDKAHFFNVARACLFLNLTTFL